ncbi:hypothetical protein BJX99DRAFT_264739 [Aspergillus californicus]
MSQSREQHMYPFREGTLICVNVIIFEYVTGVGRYQGERPSTETAKWRLVSRIWNTYLTPFVFTNFMFHSSSNRLPSLWGFLEMIVTNPDRAAMVRRLTFTTMDLRQLFEPSTVQEALCATWNYGSEWEQCKPQTEHGPETDEQIITWMLQTGILRTSHEFYNRPFQERFGKWYCTAPYKENEQWLLKAFSQVGFDHPLHGATETLLQRVRKILGQGILEESYYCPLIALVLANCPRLRHLTIHLWTSAMDPWFDWVLTLAVNGQVQGFQLEQQPMKALGTFYASPRYLGGQPAGPIVISDTQRPIYRLPQLKELMAIMMQTDIDSNINFKSKVEQLTLDSLLYKIRLPTLLNLFPNIRQLTLCIAGSPTLGGPDMEENTEPAFIKSLWEMLEKYKHRLEYLDIYQDSPRPVNSDQLLAKAYQASHYCPPFSDFTLLRQLSIPFTYLAGWKCKHRPRLSFRPTSRHLASTPTTL